MCVFFCCMEISETQGSASIAHKKLAMLVNALYGVRITFYESIYVCCIRDIWVLQAVWIVDVTLVKTQEKQVGFGVWRYLKLKVGRILLNGHA